MNIAGQGTTGAPLEYGIDTVDIIDVPGLPELPARFGWRVFDLTPADADEYSVRIQVALTEDGDVVASGTRVTTANTFDQTARTLAMSVLYDWTGPLA